MIETALILAVALIVMLMAGFWIALSLLALAVLGLFLIGNESIGLLLGTSAWGATTQWSLTALPLFIWMGEILFRTRLTHDLFDGLTPFLAKLPGGLVHINILSCGLFAAVSGSSSATAMTIGRITLPELKRKGYSDKAAIGSLAGSSTLGLLIPPSIILIIYSVSAEVSVARLFLAGIIPGVILIALFMIYTMLRSLYSVQKTDNTANYTARDYVDALKKITPILSIIAIILGSIYSGVATPTEAAAIGVFVALLLSKYQGYLSTAGFLESVKGAIKNTCMLGFILVGAHFLTLSMAFIGLPQALAQYIALMQLSQLQLILCLTLFFIILGCFLDGISIIVLTAAIILPMVHSAGIDLIWFGIFLVLVVELSQITPPIGFNLFVINALTGKNIFYIAYAALPYFAIIVLAIILIFLFPKLVLYLPSLMNK